MIRIVLGLLLGAIPITLELRGELAVAGEATRIAAWLLGLAGGLALVGGGIIALVAEIRDTRAYGAVPSGRFWLSRPSWSAIRVAVLGALATVAFASQTEVEQRRFEWPPKEELLHLPSDDVLRVMSLGYREFVADLVWVRAVGYFADHMGSDRKYHWLGRYLDAVIHLDPLFRTVYRYAGTVTMYNLKTITRPAIETSNYYLEQGYRHFPNYWEFPFTICSNYLFELPRFARDAAEKLRFQETGAEYCREASVLPGALSYLPSMVGSVLSRLGKRQLARQHYRELILRTEDPKVRAHLKRSYAALASGDSAKRIEDDAARFFRNHKESYPYASGDLFFHLGTRGEAPDGAATIRGALASKPR